ncbi:MAG: helix-turn-helix domain-containing protein [Phycisphaerales bacterium]
MPADALAPPALAPVLVDEREAARLCATSPSTIYRARKRGELAHVQLGPSSIRYTPDDLRRWAESRRVSAQAVAP